MQSAYACRAHLTNETNDAKGGQKPSHAAEGRESNLDGTALCALSEVRNG
jgi:hypothetical protein